MKSGKEEIFQSKAYKELIKKNNYNTIEFLLKENLEFMVLCYTKPIYFNPPVPEDIILFDEIAMFIISGYTFETASIDKDYFYFEAGFGSENYGSVLTVPLEAVGQIVYSEDILTISHYEPKNQNEKELNSMEILLQNPENLKLLKRKKQ